MKNSIKQIGNTLKKIVKVIARSDGRMVGSTGHTAVRKYLNKELKKTGCVPYSGDSFELAYEYRGKHLYNLVGVIPGKQRIKKPVLISGHYDSVIAAPCADDNAAAVAIALEVGRMVKERPMDRDLVIALFDAEEPPYFENPSMGSIRFLKDQMNKRGIHAMLNMDLVGHDVQIPMSYVPHIERFPNLMQKGLPIPHLRNLLFITGAESHPQMAKVIDKTKRQHHLPTIFAPNRHVGDLSDHGIFRRNGVPYLFLSCGYWQHYHEETDTPDRLNYTKMARITLYAASLIRAMASATLKSGCASITDTADLEIKSFKRTFGPTLPLFLRILGVDKLHDRDDLDDLAEALIRLGL